MTPYVEADWPALQEAVLQRFDQVRGEDGLTVSGDCPRCGHRFSSYVPLRPQTVVPGQGLTGQTAGQQLTSGPVEHVIICACSYEHEGRPDGETGCGAMTKIKLKVAGGGR